jgi:ATP-dependent DNA helicase DinG
VSDLIEATRAALDADGALARGIAGFAPRPAQQRMAEAVAEAMDSRGCLLAEAGTGTGKTYAYLVPALLSGQRVIVSTGTKALQDQLYARDLPRVREALGIGLKTALLKGRANYLCWHRLERARGEGRFATRELGAQLQQIAAWAQGTRSGDIAELASLDEASPLWPQVTSTAENCLGSECPFWDQCFVVEARRRAQEADLVVVNHHLLLADLALKQEGFGEILPGAQSFVLDEAHQLPDLAAQFFGQALGARQLVELARDAQAESQGVDGALAALLEPARRLEQAVRSLRLALDPLPARGALAPALEQTEIAEALQALREGLQTLQAALAPLREASPGLDSVGARCELLLQRLAEIETPGEIEAVRWYELSQRGFTLHQTPLDVSAPLRAFRERSGAAWIFTSATLAVAGRFEHFADQLGLDQPQTLLEPSPFDYAAQTLAWLPPRLPEPSARDYTEAVLERLLPALQASGGRAFLLFTSHRALRRAADWLPERCDFPLFVQGSLPRAQLLQAFRDSGNGVLLGAASFWEGVDVAGEALSLVAIDKLPFAAPDDPVLEARLAAIRRGGGNPFRDWQLPTAAIALKQGAGRLIRTHADRGVLVLCDPRLLSKPYGRLFLDSLPPMPRTRELADVQGFFAGE